MILASGLIYILVYSPIFRVDQFTFQGNKRLSNEAVMAIIRPLIFQGRIANFLGWNNFLSWPNGGVDVSGTAFLEAMVYKDWLTRSITIAVQERERFGIWCVNPSLLEDRPSSKPRASQSSKSEGGEICYWIDEEGVMFEEAPLTEGTLILKVRDIKNPRLAIGFQVLEDRFINNLIAILKNLKDFNFAVENLILDRELQELKVETYDGLLVLFSIRFDPQLNINSFKELQGILDFKKIKYIDLRVENRIYYKNK